MLSVLSGCSQGSSHVISGMDACSHPPPALSIGKRVAGLRLKGLLVTEMFSKETRFLIREQIEPI